MTSGFSVVRDDSGASVAYKAFRNSTAYIQSWLKSLRNDCKMIIFAAAKAEKAVKYIFNDKEQE